MFYNTLSRPRTKNPTANRVETVFLVPSVCNYLKNNTLFMWEMSIPISGKKVLPCGGKGLFFFSPRLNNETGVFCIAYHYESIIILISDNWFLPLNLNTNTLLFMAKRISLPCEENELSFLVMYLPKAFSIFARSSPIEKLPL